MSDITPEPDPLASGMDDGTGDPNDDRTYLQDQPPAQVDEQAVSENSEEENLGGEDFEQGMREDHFNDDERAAGDTR